jgi:hypothetical protein
VSIKAMMKHRVDVLRLSETQVDGMPVHTWTQVASGQRAYLDLNYIRKGKDPIWTPEAGRASDRSGVLFMMGDAPIMSGDRIKVTTGPSGTFQIEGAVDEAWKPERKHHLEVGVVEVSGMIAT